MASGAWSPITRERPWIPITEEVQRKVKIQKEGEEVNEEVIKSK